MAYLSSSLINVFPSVKRGKKQVSARLMSEEFVASIVNKLIDKEGFLITQTYDTTQPLEFNIHGYYFKVATLNDILTAVSASTATKIYANIRIKQDGNYKELYGQDDEVVESGVVTSSSYKGLELSTGSPVSYTGYDCYSLLLLERSSTSSAWGLPRQSFYKYSTESLDITIDGGDLDTTIQ